MSQNHIPILHLGLDIAKLTLQLDLAGQPHALANDAKGHAQLLKRLRGQPGAHVVCEATGGYEQPVARVRHFAKAKGLRAKTDPIDAAVLSEYGRTLKPAATTAPTPQQTRLAELSTRRLQRLATLTAEATLSAVRYDASLKAFYMRLRTGGKKPKVALVACMRKLVVLMNRLLKNPKFQLAE